MGIDTLLQIRLLRAPSRLDSNTAGDGAAMSSLGSLFHPLTTLTVKNLFLTFNWNLFPFKFKIIPLWPCKKPPLQISCKLPFGTGRLLQLLPGLSFSQGWTAPAPSVFLRGWVLQPQEHLCAFPLYLLWQIDVLATLGVWGWIQHFVCGVSQRQRGEAESPPSTCWQHFFAAQDTVGFWDMSAYFWVVLTSLVVQRVKKAKGLSILLATLLSLLKNRFLSAGSISLCMKLAPDTGNSC